MKLSRHTTTLALGLLAAVAAPAALACKAPIAPSAIPDGQTAGLEAMQEAKRNVDAYIQQVADYMSCETNGVKLQEAKAQRTEIVNWFNAEVRAYKAVRSPALANTRR